VFKNNEQENVMDIHELTLHRHPIPHRL